MMRLGLLKFKFFLMLLILVLIMLFLSSCDQTILDIYTEVNSDFSGKRIVDIAVKTEYIKKGEIAIGNDKPLFDKIFDSLPEGEITTSEKDGYTHFTSAIDFEDINFLPHVSIDNFSENPPDRFYAKIEKEESFFSIKYYFEDFVDMKIDESVLKSGGVNSDLYRLDNIVKTDREILKITYQIKFPFKVLKSNSDFTGDNRIAVWDIKYGEQKFIRVEGEKTKLLSYFLLVILGIVLLFILFLIIAIIFNATRKKIEKRRSKPLYSYDNYFKKNRQDKF
jgi:Na+-transporting methylmalonyl-CoA/oxaloacetate decarboxylase gamma subunit